MIIYSGRIDGGNSHFKWFAENLYNQLILSLKFAWINVS
jgi:hypothetical protein